MSSLSGLSIFQVIESLASGFFETGPPDALSASSLARTRALTSLTTARRLSVTNATSNDESSAARSLAKRARTWKYRAAGLSTSLGSEPSRLHGLQVSSGSLVLPVRVETSSAPVDSQLRRPKRARSPASSTLLVQTASGPPTPRTG